MPGERLESASPRFSEWMAWSQLAPFCLCSPAARGPMTDCGCTSIVCRTKERALL